MSSTAPAPTKSTTPTTPAVLSSCRFQNFQNPLHDHESASTLVATISGPEIKPEVVRKGIDAAAGAGIAVASKQTIAHKVLRRNTIQGFSKWRPARQNYPGRSIAFTGTRCGFAKRFGCRADDDNEQSTPTFRPRAISMIAKPNSEFLGPLSPASARERAHECAGSARVGRPCRHRTVLLQACGRFARREIASSERNHLTAAVGIESAILRDLWDCEFIERLNCTGGSARESGPGQRDQGRESFLRSDCGRNWRSGERQAPEVIALDTSANSGSLAAPFERRVSLHGENQ